MRIQISILTICTGMILFLGCSESTQNTSSKKNEEAKEKILPNEASVLDESIDWENVDMDYAIPTHLLVSNTLMIEKIPFSNEHLNDPKNVSNYNNDYKRALNLGVYRTDIGYLNTFRKTEESIEYINSINQLATEMKVNKFFPGAAMIRLAKEEKIDSLMHLMAFAYNQTDQYLRNKDKSILSVLIQTGTFVETVNLSAQFFKTHPTDNLKANIGEQKIALNNLILILEAYKKDLLINELLSEFKKLHEEYAKIQIEYKYSEPELEEVDGKLVVKDKTSHTIEIGESVMESIIEIVSKIREKIV